jgi:uncharacterized protein involved in exopolysaccharide biosynthesis
VIEKMLEAFFRHWVLILLPVLAIPLDVTAFVLSTPPQYEAQAGVWVERPTYLAYSGDDLTRYLPPAMVQRNKLEELMRTRSFISDLVAGTPLSAYLALPGGDVQLDQIFARDFDTIQNGDHLLVVRFRAESRDLAVQIVNSTVDQFRLRASDDRRAQAQLAISFYQARVTDSEARLAQARSDQAKYLTTNPQIAQTLARQGLDVARLDPQFAELQRSVDAAQHDADAAQSYLQSAQLDVSAGVQSDTVTFRVVDPTGVSASPSRQLKKVLVFPIAALIGAFVLSAGLLLFFALSDHSVRSLADLAPDTVILGVMPRLRMRKVPHAGAHLTRRAVGFVAGSALALNAGDRDST